LFDRVIGGLEELFKTAHLCCGIGLIEMNLKGETNIRFRLSLFFLFVFDFK